MDEMGMMVIRGLSVLGNSRIFPEWMHHLAARGLPLSANAETIGYV